MKKILLALIVLTVMFSMSFAENRPFPQSVTYYSGVCLPTNASYPIAKVQQDTFNYWAAHRTRFWYTVTNAQSVLTANEHLIGTGICKAEYYNDLGYNSPPASAFTVSEVHGWMMSLIPLMASTTSYASGFSNVYTTAQADFNAFLNYYAINTATRSLGMAWQQIAMTTGDINTNTHTIAMNRLTNTTEDHSHVLGTATDGDLDIAYGLLLADKQWGSDTDDTNCFITTVGATPNKTLNIAGNPFNLDPDNDGNVNYKSLAIQIITNIRKWLVNSGEESMAPLGTVNHLDTVNLCLNLGDWVPLIWTNATYAKYTNGTRPSDWEMNVFKRFAQVDTVGSNTWMALAQKLYNDDNYNMKVNSPGIGLMPDFALQNGTNFAPVSGNYLESKNDGCYNYNSCRVPWKHTVDYIVNGDNSVYGVFLSNANWIKSSGAANNVPGNIKAGYKLTGAKLVSYTDLSFIAPFGVGAMINPTLYPWLTNIYSTLNTDWMDNSIGDEYGFTIEMYARILMAGAYWEAK